jgi:hypothetical protein
MGSGRRWVVVKSIDEHADDLESTVHENAAEETASYPDTGDELDDTDGEDEEDVTDLDEDPAEL